MGLYSSVVPLRIFCVPGRARRNSNRGLSLLVAGRLGKYILVEPGGLTA